MPLLDHFHPPLSERRHWQAFHSRWASAIADGLNAGQLPENLFAEPTVHVGGQVHVDVATFEESSRPQFSQTPNGIATLPQTAKLSAPDWVIPANFSDAFEVRVINTEGGPQLVAAIELVSPSNKDRPLSRRAFAAKCANYLWQGIPCIVLDVVTSRTANLHNEILDLMQSTDYRLPDKTTLYATSYRPVRRDSRELVEVWYGPTAIGQTLPSLPFHITPDLFLTLDFEESYRETCAKLRL